MSHIYIDGTKITANANKGNDRLFPRYNIQQCKQKKHRDSLFRESRLFNMLFLYSTFCGADDGNRTHTLSQNFEKICLLFAFRTQIVCL